MVEFAQAVAQHGFLQTALLVGLLASLACGVIGTYVVVRRITYIAGAIAHCVLGGIGIAKYLNIVVGLKFVSPLLGATVMAVVAALIIGLVSIRARQREDTIIGAIWAIGMALGILFISRTPGYSEDLMSYLFGDILLVTSSDLWLILALDGLVLGAVILFYNRFLAVCFDEQFARLRGVRVELVYLLLLVLTALTVVLLVTVVGLVMVIALITLPAAVAGQFAKNLWQMMAISTVLCAVYSTAGLALSYGPDFPAGATVILLAGAVYFVVTLGRLVLHRGRA